MEEAFKHGADFVEFDVQLTKDKIAVIFHDFHVLVSAAKQKNFFNKSTLSLVDCEEANTLHVDTNSNKDSLNVIQPESIIKDNYYKMAVKDLNLTQLRLLHVIYL